jgi:hypothetical protein
MFSGAGLLISLPGAEVRDIDLPGSLAELHDVLAATISPELRSAVLLLRDAALERGVEPKFIVRPEIFTNGVSEHWLHTRTGGISQHLCLSDGTSLKHISGFQTHVFFYCLSFLDNLLALRTLFRHAPELMTQARSQVNSSFALGNGGRRVQPVPIFLSRAIPLDHPPSTLLPFLLNRDSAEDSADRIEQQGPIVPESLTGFTEARYVPLTETAMNDRAFARTVAELMLRACFDPATLLVLRLPFDRGGNNTLARRVAAILPALRDTGIVIPRASPRNIVFATQDLEEDHPILDRFSLRILVHESFDFWRHSFGFYARAARVTVLASAESPFNPGFLPYDVSEVYGATSLRRWVDPATRD